MILTTQILEILDLRYNRLDIHILVHLSSMKRNSDQCYVVVIFIYLRLNMDIRFLLLFTLGLIYSADGFNSKWIASFTRFSLIGPAKLRGGEW